jgi:hypothetical protein
MRDDTFSEKVGPDGSEPFINYGSGSTARSSGC